MVAECDAGDFAISGSGFYVAPPGGSLRAILDLRGSDNSIWEATLDFNPGDPDINGVVQAFVTCLDLPPLQ